MNSRRERWFRTGSEALRRTLDAHGFAAEIGVIEQYFDGKAYACPCCLDLYGQDALVDSVRTLTDEDVPPKAIGGRPLVLTCRNCNNTAGKVWDADAINYRRMQALISGQWGGPVPVTLTVDGLAVRMQLSSDKNGLLLEYVEQANNPKLTSGAGTFIERALAAGTEPMFRIGPGRPVDGGDAAWSWIRGAYLAAFAVFGYRYALLWVLAPLRQHLANPTSAPPPRLFHQTLMAPPGPPRMLVIHSPERLRGLVAVSFGDIHVFLPTAAAPQPIDHIEQAVAMLDSRNAHAPSGQEIPWPFEPQYLLDT